jgi:hypothetical protein
MGRVVFGSAIGRSIGHEHERLDADDGRSLWMPE